MWGVFRHLETKKSPLESTKNKTDSKTSRYGHLAACWSTGQSTDRSSRKEPLAPVDWAVDRSVV